MRLTIVGCSGSHPGPESSCSCYLVEHEGFRLLLDLGNGSLGPLQRFINPNDIDAIYLSHLHGDHWLDLVPLAHVRRHPRDAEVRVLPVMAPVTERGRIAGAFGVPASDLDDIYAFEDPADGAIGPFDVKLIRTQHPVETHAIRLTAGGKTLVYTADTGPFDALSGFALGADLLLAEAGFADGMPPKMHLRGMEGGRLAADADVGQLVITHVAPWDDSAAALAAAREMFVGSTTLAWPGAVYDV
ncbi:MAG TPA: MBL fold metallo-hydrolase [Acidothermaceae bacterium]|jgi:ribonuclease BN (tRNA processing enzyme)